MCDGRGRYSPVKMPQPRHPKYAGKAQRSIFQEVSNMNDLPLLSVFAVTASLVLIRQAFFFAPALKGLDFTDILKSAESLFPAAVAGPILALIGCAAFLASVRNISPGMLKFVLLLLIGIRLLWLIPLPSMGFSYDSANANVNKNPYSNAEPTSHAELPEGTGERWCSSGTCDSSGENASTHWSDNVKVNSADIDSDEVPEAQEDIEQEYEDEVAADTNQKSEKTTHKSSGDADLPQKPQSMLEWFASSFAPTYAVASDQVNGLYNKFMSAEKIYGREMKTDDKGRLVVPEEMSTALVPVGGPLPDSLTEKETGRIIIHESPHFQNLHRMVHKGKQYNVPVFNAITAAAIFVFLFCGRYFPHAAASLGQTSNFLLWHGLKFILFSTAAVAVFSSFVFPFLSASFINIASSCFASLVLASTRSEAPDELQEVEQTCRSWILALVPNPIPGIIFSSLGALLALWALNLALSSLKLALCSAVSRSYKAAVHDAKADATSVSGVKVIMSDVWRCMGSLTFASLLLAIAQGAHWACDLPVYFNRVHPYLGLLLILLGDIPLSFAEAFLNCLVVPLLAISGKPFVAAAKEAGDVLRGNYLGVLTLLVCSMAVHWVVLPFAMGFTATIAGWTSWGLFLWFGTGLSPFFLAFLGSLTLLSALASLVTSVSWCTFICIAQDNTEPETKYPKVLVC